MTREGEKPLSLDSKPSVDADTGSLPAESKARGNGKIPEFKVRRYGKRTAKLMLGKEEVLSQWNPRGTAGDQVQVLANRLNRLVDDYMVGCGEFKELSRNEDDHGVGAQKQRPAKDKAATPKPKSTGWGPPTNFDPSRFPEGK